MKKLRYGLWGLVAIGALAFVLLLGHYRSGPGIYGDTSQGHAGTATAPAGFNQGTHFKLTAHTGEPFDTRSDIPDRSLGLLFFGFTHCPVICPTELQKFAAVMDALPDDMAARIKPLFVTVDPERDTVEALADYVPQFHPAIIGLTGSGEEISKVLTGWRVYAARVEDPAFTDYTMDHSTFSYLIDADMRILALFRMKDAPAAIAEAVRAHLQAAE